MVLDPLIEAETAGTNIRDAKVCSGEPDKNYQAEGYLGAGRHSSRGVERFYIKYEDLPALKAADVVVNAGLNLGRGYDCLLYTSPRRPYPPQRVYLAQRQY